VSPLISPTNQGAHAPRSPVEAVSKRLRPMGRTIAARLAKKKQEVRKDFVANSGRWRSRLARKWTIKRLTPPLWDGIGSESPSVASRLAGQMLRRVGRAPAEAPALWEAGPQFEW